MMAEKVFFFNLRVILMTLQTQNFKQIYQSLTKFLIVSETQTCVHAVLVH
jgi:hypothetical protein